MMMMKSLHVANPQPNARYLESNSYHQIGQSANASIDIELDVLQVGSEPVGIRCPHCQEDVMTRATYKNTRITHIVAIILGVLFWWLCCCFAPYLVNRWKNVEHYCPRCRKFLGVYTRKSII
ncbi:hypothetical protein ABMA28_012082 [Loxostege sticticalis]|uniref:LITAF domain-containing protein n=1 Tax=Loxostege sticticalis TaxID=481309 RepID=A0ABD0TLJ6_LOXSC